MPKICACNLNFSVYPMSWRVQPCNWQKQMKWKRKLVVLTKYSGTHRLIRGSTASKIDLIHQPEDGWRAKQKKVELSQQLSFLLDDRSFLFATTTYLSKELQYQSDRTGSVNKIWTIWHRRPNKRIKLSNCSLFPTLISTLFLVAKLEIQIYRVQLFC